MAEKYVFDANEFINLQRRQPIDVYPVVWDAIGALVDKGIIVSSREVYDELLEGKDQLSDWAKQRKECFVSSEVPVQKCVREILQEHRGLVEGGKKKNTADPFIIAIAKINRCTVVTEETPTKSPVAPKIPDVCAAYGIRNIDFVTFLREQNISFSK